MPSKALHTVALALAGLALVLGVADAFLYFRNQSLQSEVDQRQQYVNGTAGIARLNDELVKALAATAYNNKDNAIRDLLHANGVDYNVTPNAATGTPAATPAAAAASPAAATPTAASPATPAQAAPKPGTTSTPAGK